MNARTGRDKDWPHLWDGFTEDEVKEVAERNADAFYEMKKSLVKKRQSTCSIEDMARALGRPVEDVADFEQYYSDPTVSQIQVYALALTMKVGVDAMGYRDAPKEYLNMTVPCPRPVVVDSLRMKV